MEKNLMQYIIKQTHLNDIIVFDITRVLWDKPSGSFSTSSTQKISPNEVLATLENLFLVWSTVYQLKGASPQKRFSSQFFFQDSKELFYM